MSGMDNSQLRDLLDAAVGEPPHRVTVPAVRRRLVKRRLVEAVAATAAVIAVGLGVAAAVRVFGPGPGAAATSRAGAPHYYVQETFGGAGRPQPAVVRATATGVVTATIRCPWPDAQIAPQGMTAAGHRAFFVVCQKTARHGKGFVVTGARIYQFRLSGSGGISGYSLVPGGVLGQHRVEDVAASLDGAQLAVTVGPASLSATSPEQADVLVINSQTGVRAIWHGGVKVFGAADLTFTSGGRELQFLGRTRCGQTTGTTKARGAATCRELRAVSPAAAGGELDSSRLLLRLSALIRSPADYVNDVVISPDGSTLTAAVIHSRSRPHQSTSILIIKYSAATGRQLHVLYRMRTGNGFFYRFFGSDPTGRYLLFNAGPTSGTVNGWIDHGRLIRLKPADGSNVFYETW